MSICRGAGGYDAVQQYVASMGDVGVLTKEEEVQLGAIVHLGQQVCLHHTLNCCTIPLQSSTSHFLKNVMIAWSKIGFSPFPQSSVRCTLLVSPTDIHTDSSVAQPSTVLVVVLSVCACLWILCQPT